jgi:methylase of polypeptide subunit release factors
MSRSSSIGQALHAAGFDATAVAEATVPGGRLRRPELRPVADRLTLDEQEGSGLVRLFVLGERALAADVPPELHEAPGLTRREGDRVVPLARIDVLDGLLIASDLDVATPEFVAPVSPSTQLVAEFTPQTPVRTALDVGTGSGVHALRMARWAEHVIATDLNPRALAFTRLNAELNGMTNVETREGSLLEPVTGERFDQIVCNPPYVISPDVSYLYRDAPQRGDALSRHLLAELPEALTDGGTATLQGNWTHAEEDRSWAPIEAGLKGTGCDALIARLNTWAPLPYALGWASSHHHGDPAGFEATVRRWRASYDFEAVTAATLVLRRRPGASHWRTGVTLRGMPDGLGPRLAGLFAAQQRELLGAVLQPAEGLTVERYQRPGEPEQCTLQCLATPAVRRPVPPALADAVLALDGPLTSVPAGMAALVKLGFVTFA